MYCVCACESGCVHPGQDFSFVYGVCLCSVCALCMCIVYVHVEVGLLLGKVSLVCAVAVELSCGLAERNVCVCMCMCIVYVHVEVGLLLGKVSLVCAGLQYA